jgi:hypothetical protein
MMNKSAKIEIARQFNCISIKSSNYYTIFFPPNVSLTNIYKNKKWRNNKEREMSCKRAAFSFK